MGQELERVYIVHCSGEYCGTDSHDVLICKPSDLYEALNEMAWAHHEQWAERDEDEDEEEPECRSSAYETEYTPETSDNLDGHRSGGGSFMDDHGVIEAWRALGYGLPKFDGDNAYECRNFIKRWSIPICQAGASWQELENWQRQIIACRDVIRALDSLNHQCVPHLSPLLDTQLKGAYAMAENEQKIIEANVQKVVARLKAL